MVVLPAVTADGVVTSWSAGARETFGWTTDDMVDEQWWIRQDGREVSVTGSIHPLQSTAAGGVPEFLIIVRDETTQRRADGAMKQLTEALERRVEQQAQKLHDSQDFARLALTAVGGVGVRRARDTRAIRGRVPLPTGCGVFPQRLPMFASARRVGPA